jgi:hypothetical protein
MKTRLLLWCIFLLPQLSRGQSDTLFEMLNLSYCTSGILLDKIPDPVDLPEENRYSKLEAETWWNQLQKSTLASTALQLPNRFETLENMRNYASDFQVTPLALVDMNYEQIDPNAAINGALLFDGVHLLQQNQSANIFETKNASFVLSHLSKCATTHLEFEFLSALSITNKGQWSPYIELDANDGLGLRTVTWDSPFEIDYTETYSDKSIWIQWSVNGVTSSTTLVLKGIMCDSHFDAPVPDVPWPNSIVARNNNEHWRIGTHGPHGKVFGNAYYLPRGDFDKPFIFVEGIDFDRTQSPLQNGDFGWCQFTSGNTDPNFEYNFISEMPLLLRDLQNRGYDIILLDFEDGAHWLEDNGSLLMHLIQLVNETKVGNGEITLAGASMGGVISRYALSTMEQQEIPHCVKTYVSLDAPHQGAYIPVALQQMLVMLSDEAMAQNFIHNNLERPAAKQMLLAQALPTDNSPDIFNDYTHTTWQQQLSDLGFPQKCRSVAIANGNFHGEPLNSNLYASVMDQSCELASCSAGPEVKFYMATSAGNPWFNNDYAESDANYNVSAQFLRSQLNTDNPEATSGWDGVWNFIALLNCDIAKFIHTGYVPVNSINYDYAPGGTRKSVHEFANAINSTNDLTDAGCMHLFSYQLEHAFVTTTSALNLPVSNPYTNASNWIASHPEQITFDALYGAPAGNERHASLNALNRTFILEQVTGGEDEWGNPLIPAVLEPLTAQGPEFNFGKSNFNYLSNTSIREGQEVHINKYNHLHYGNEPMPQLGSHFTCHLRGNCNSNLVEVVNQGLLSVGDELGQTTAELIVHEGSILRIGAQGKLYIQSGSKLRLKAGSVLEIDDEAKVIINDETNVLTSLVIEPGATVKLGNALVTLHGDKSRIEMRGGELVVLDGSVAHISPSGDAGGQVVCTESTHSSTVLGNDSKLFIDGQNNADPLFHMQGNSTLSVLGTNGSLRFGAGLIILNSNALLDANQNTFFFKCTVVPEMESTTNAVVASTNSVLRFSSCTVREVNIQGSFSTLSALKSTFIRNPQMIKLNSSTYDIRQCSFINASIESHSSHSENYVVNSIFLAEGDTEGELTFLYDKGLSTLEVRESEFYKGGIALQKNNGDLFLRCSTFEENYVGMKAAYRAKASLSAGKNGGYNYFFKNKNHIVLELATELNLMNGFNTFGEASAFCISGELFGNCGENCGTALLTTSRNVWPYQLTPGNGPNSGLDYFPAQIALQVVNPLPFGCSGCEAILSDLGPLPLTKGCPTPSDSEVPQFPKMLQADALVWPNPASDLVTISFEGRSVQGEYRVVDLAGALVQSGKTSETSSIQIDVRSIPTGYYLFIVSDGEASCSVPFAIMH